MPHKRATLADVARTAGVHPSTVSRALDARKRSLLTPAVIARVQQAARSLGYSRDAVAAGLRTRRSATIGILIPDLANPLFPPIVRGAEAVLAEAGYTTIIANTDNDPRRARAALEQLAARRVDGVILAAAARREPLVARCQALHLPLVLVNRSTQREDVSAIGPDDVQGMSLAVGHLVRLGHRRIVHVAGPQTLSTGAARRRGFVTAIAAAAIPVRVHDIAVAASYGIEAGVHAAETLLARTPRPTAIVAANDLLALGCYDALARRGLRCPADVSIVGFNDMPFAERFAPPLTTVRVPQRTMGLEAAQALLRAIEEPSGGCVHLRLPCELVVRSSTTHASDAAAGTRGARREAYGLLQVE